MASGRNSPTSGLAGRRSFAILSTVAQRVSNPSDPINTSASELKHEREALQRGLSRSRLAAVAVLVIAAALAAGAVIAAFRAQHLAEENRERLWQSLVDQARSERLSGEVGSRTKALQAIREAAAIRPTEGLRDEAIAALSLIDLQVVERWSGYPEDAQATAFSHDLTYHAIEHTETIQVLTTANRKLVMTAVKQPQDSGQHRLPESKQLLFSPDERLLAGMFTGGLIVVWGVEAKTELWRTTIARSDVNICGLSFDADSMKLAITTPSKGTASIHEAHSGTLLQEVLTSHTATKLALRPDGQSLAWTDKSIHVIELDSGRSLFERPLPTAAMEIRWSPDGSRVAVGCQGGELWIIDPSTGFVIDCEPASSVIHGMDFCPDGRFLMASAWDGMTRIWDTHQGTLRLKTAEARGHQFDASGDRLGFYRLYSELGIWELVSSSVHRGYAAPRRRFHDGFRGLDLSPDGRWIVASSRTYQHRYIWERSTGRLVWEDRAGIISSLFDAETDWLYGVNDQGLHRWPIQTEEGFALGAPQLIASGEGTLFNMALGSEGRRWASTCDSKGVGYHIDMSASAPKMKRLVKGLKREDGISTFSHSANGEWGVVSNWRSRTTELWELKQQALNRELDVFGGKAAFLPGGHQLAVGSQRGLVIWNVDRWHQEALFPFHSSTSLPTVLGFSFDEPLVSYHDTPSSIQLIDLESLQPVATFAAPNRRRLYDHRLSDDATGLLSSSVGHLDLWNFPALKDELASLGLSFGVQMNSEAAGKNPAEFSPATAAIIATGILITALGFGLYVMHYQRRLIREFDIQYSALEQTQKELLQAEKLKALGTLSAGVAHDFKNLLSVIRLSNDLIKRDADGNTDILEEVDAIGLAVSQGDQVVKAMLGYSRSRLDQDGPVDVPSVIEGTVALLGQQFLSGLRLHLEIERDLPKAIIPSGALEQILLNLVVNASEAMEKAGELSIHAKLIPNVGRTNPILRPSESQYGIAVSVADNGPGMDEETQKRIFEPFFTTKTVGSEKGTGLGLATVYKIAKDNQLGLEVRSEVAQGTCFDILIPV